jgi:hypothetical protein
MSNRKNLVAVGSEAEGEPTIAAAEAATLAGDDAPAEHTAAPFEDHRGRGAAKRSDRFGWIVQLLVVIDWTVFALIHQRAILGGASLAVGRLITPVRAGAAGRRAVAAGDAQQPA